MVSENILAITSRYKHHGESTGYVQLKKFLPPKYEVGIDETKNQPYIVRAYKWLFEFYAWYKYRKSAKLLHIYYGEEYYRFSSILFKNIPIVATFHQPPEKLMYEILQGGDGGRIYRFTHRLTKNRFKRLSAAIVLEESQKEVLKQVMPESKIHVIYHGIFTENSTHIEFSKKNKSPFQILTIGNWLRNWEFYEEVIASFERENHPVIFKLINRQINLSTLEKLSSYKNFSFIKNADDDLLQQEIKNSLAVFLPLQSAAGNNAVMESLALGTPLILPDIYSLNYQLRNSAVRFYSPNQINSCKTEILELISVSTDEYESIQKDALKLIKRFDWSEIAKQTATIYKMVQNKDEQS
jgi:glycosyltransferase involved in cell wall biosynthesis